MFSRYKILFYPTLDNNSGNHNCLNQNLRRLSMGFIERNIVRKFANYSVYVKNYFENCLKDNNRFINSHLIIRSKIETLVSSKKISKYTLTLYPISQNQGPPETSSLSKEEKKTNYRLHITKLWEEINISVRKSENHPTPKWKTHSPSITIEGINSLTKYLLISLGQADSVSSRLKRLEELLEHLVCYPTAKNFAVQKGAIGILSFIKKHTNDTPTLEKIRQCLAVLGYVDPPRSSGIRILSIDGGGMRGIAVIRMLQKIEEMSGKKICDLFDIICGVSTGAIITSCLISPTNMSLNSIYDLYKDLSTRVFNQSYFFGTGMLLWSGAYYDTSVWEKFLSDYVGTLSLIDSTKDPCSPKIAIVSTIINQSKVAPFVFRNYGEPYSRSSEYLGSFRHTMFEAVRASAAAPTIFEEFKIGDLLHQDGGLIVNNPAAIALHEAKTLWPDEPICCVVSIGTGRYEPVISINTKDDKSKNSSSWKQVFTKILESATDTEAVHRVLNDLLPEKVYFRLNPHLSRVISMDETNELKISELEKDTKMYCRRNEDKFNELVSKLISPRPPLKQLKDYVNIKLKSFGFTNY